MTKGKLTGLILFAAILAAAPTASAAQNPQSFLLSTVSVKGTTRYQSSAVAAAAGLKIGQTVTTADLRNAANRLASLGVFSDVNYSYVTRDGGMSVVFTLKDAPLYPCVFDNLVWFSRRNLIQQLSSRVALFQGEAPAAGDMIDRISAALTSMLQSRGIHAHVQLAGQATLGGAMRSIDFQEVGVRVPIEKVDFPGDAKLQPSVLQAAAKPLIGQDYDAAYVQGFAQGALRDAYRAHGFLLASLGVPVPSLLASSSTPDAVAVTFPVTEGEQFRLKSITFSGQSAVPYKKLAKSLHASEGKPANAVQLESDVLSMILLFHPIGYIDASLKAVAALDSAAGTVSYRIQVQEGDLYHLGRLEIEGVPGNRTASIERLSHIQPGDPFNADYWAVFVRKAYTHLPSRRDGWKASIKQIIHRDTKTVDVAITFSPVAPPVL